MIKTFSFVHLILLILMNSITLTTLASNSFEKTYPAFNFTDWPNDVIEPLKIKIPELNKTKFNEEELDQIIKKVHQELNFDSLKIISKNNQLYLVGQMSQKIETIQFINLNDLDYEDAIELTGLNPIDAATESKVQIALEKLQSYYRNRGYRKAVVSYKYETIRSIARNLIVEINLGAKTIVSDIIVEGLPYNDKNKVERYFNWHGKGDVLSDETLKKVNQALRESLNSLGYYLTSIQTPQIVFSADERRVRIIYKLTPTPLYGVEIYGQKSFSASYLEDDILKLNEYSTNDMSFGAELAEKLKAFYLSKGYAQVEVSFSEKKKQNKIIEVLNIQEGPQVYIKKISFIGNYSRPENYYIKKLYSLGSIKLQDKLLIKDDLDIAVKNLQTQLQNEGFVSAKISRVSIELPQGRSSDSFIEITLDEGLQTNLNKINFKGNIAFNDIKLLEMLNLKSGQKLNLLELEKSLTSLRLFYSDNGFIEAKILNQNKNLITYSENLLEANLQIEIAEGPQVTVNTVLVEGNSLTHTKLILTELEFKPGDLLTPAKIDESIARLQRTGHFSTIEIYTLEANTQVKDRTVVVRVSERNPGVFTSGLGLTNENNYTLQGYLGIAYRNIGGWGRGASARAEIKYNPDYIRFLESKITFGFLEPYLFESRVRFRINYTSSRNVSDLSIRKVTLTNQAVWSIEQDFSSHITGIYEVLNVSNYVDRGIDETDEQKFKYSREDLVISTTGPTLDFDYRDNILNPQKGHFSRLTLEYASSNLGNHNVDDFYRVTAQTTLYTPIIEDWNFSWANSVRAGYVKDIGDKKFGVPFDKKGFILGGRTTVRAFDTGEYFPASNRQIPVNYKFKDYSQYNLIKSELRFPLTKSADLMGAIFYDGGIVYVDDIQFVDPYRDALGIGLRYNTPVGPLNLEYARKLDKQSYESDGAFYLSVGVF